MNGHGNVFLDTYLSSGAGKSPKINASESDSSSSKVNILLVSYYNNKNTLQQL